LNSTNNDRFEEENRKLKEQVKRLSNQSEKYKKLFEASADALSIIDLDSGKFIECNESAIKMHGVENEESFLNLKPSEISPEKQPCGGLSLNLARERIKKSYTHGPQLFEWIHSKSDGSTFPCLVSLTALKIDGVKYVLAIGRNISKLKEHTKELEHLNEKLIETSNTDYLTGLFNRKFLDEVSCREISRSNRYKSKLSCLFLDIDNFKKVNDLFGHDIGDKVLIDLANILNECAREADVCARWGGEEFCVLLPDTCSTKALDVAERYRCLIENHTFQVIGRITVSIGVTEYISATPMNLMFKNADEALYQAKNSGKNKVVLV
jgi:diguanylate cyclase (GGDEF)-like protein/PAS domain S-box-containing protein